MKTRELIRDIIQDIAILDGTNVGPSGSSWQDVASTLASNLTRLAGSLCDMRTGDRPIDLPDLDMIVDSIQYQRGGDAADEIGEES